MNIRSYNNVTQLKFNALLGEASSNGITVKGNTLTSHRVTVEYTYIPIDCKLTLEITHKSFPSNFVSDNDIFTQIEKATGLNA